MPKWVKALIAAAVVLFVLVLIIQAAGGGGGHGRGRHTGQPASPARSSSSIG